MNQINSESAGTVIEEENVPINVHDKYRISDKDDPEDEMDKQLQEILETEESGLKTDVFKLDKKMMKSLKRDKDRKAFTLKTEHSLENKGEEFEPSLLQERRKRQKKPAQRKVTSVYITGLPQDITLDELHEHFKPCGIILPDLESGTPKIKIYEGPDGKPKGDALVIYLKEESVQLAEKLLDESMIRPGIQIRVQKASFTKKEPFEASTGLDMQSKRKLRNIHKKLEWF